MAQTKLRIYYGPETDEAITALEPSRYAKQTVTVPLGEILPLLADAASSEKTWLRDFDDDEVTISGDLYEVILAYQHYRRPSA